MPTSRDPLAPGSRSSSIGAVLTDICRDLGNHKGHRLWAELFDAIIQYDGALARLCRGFGLHPWTDPAILTRGNQQCCRLASRSKKG
jgi:hypothetical protein